MGSCHCKDSNEISSIKVIQYPSKAPDRALTLADQISKLSLPGPSQKITDAVEPSELKPDSGSFNEMINFVKIAGVPCESKQEPFEDKKVAIFGHDNQIDVLKKSNMWVCCKKGLKPTQPNQDDFVIIIEDSNFMLGVFDGHGVYGHHISNFVHSELPKLLLSHPSWQETPERALKDSFVRVHQNLIKHSCLKESQYDCNMSGCTSTIIHKRKSSLFIAHVGDSRGILGRKTDSGHVAIVLNIDHKPDTSEEKERIESAGGEVRKLPGRNPSRVYFKGREYPGLSMTRALGDLVSQTIGVICVPQTNEVILTENDEFIVLCSDGVWEFISDDEAVRVVSTSNRDPKEAACRLAALAWTKWISNEGNVVDDITVIVTFLNTDDLS
jgi:serine/threonine protein phosphatase PrpC